jgi:hypothetical protein
MKIPRISEKQLCRLGKINSALWLAFKIGLPLGAGILVVGTLGAGLLDMQRFGDRVPPRVSSVAEAVMSLACIALSLNCILEGYVSIQGAARSVRFIINRILLYVITAVLLGSGAIVLGILAVREWLNL